MGWNDRREFKELLGKTLKEIHVDDETVVFHCDDGKVFKLYHSQDCCEHVYLAEVIGDWADLIGEPILSAEESTGDTPADHKFDYEPESYTWTFYKLATRKGYLDMRWLGMSNGYYSEGVDFEEVV